MRTITTRIVVVFLVLRVIAAGMGAAAAQLDFSSALEPSVVGTLWTWAAVVIALRIDLGRRSELVLLANLGYGPRRLVVFAIVGCAALELLIRAAV